MLYTVDSDQPSIGTSHSALPTSAWHWRGGQQRRVGLDRKPWVASLAAIPEPSFWIRFVDEGIAKGILQEPTSYQNDDDGEAADEAADDSTVH